MPRIGRAIDNENDVTWVEEKVLNLNKSTNIGTSIKMLMLVFYPLLYYSQHSLGIREMFHKQSLHKNVTFDRRVKCLPELKNVLK